MSDQAKLGKLCEPNAVRDAVHIAIAPVIAGEMLLPGQRVAYRKDGKAYRSVMAHGIVDPWLRQPVEAGQRFNLCLDPGSITSLSHHWSHPAFEPLLPVGEEAYDR